MRLLRWIAGFILTLSLAGFAVFNRQTVDFYWSPLHDQATVPLYIIALGFMAAGFLTGAITVWLNAAPRRSATRQQKKQIKALEKELAVISRKPGDEPPADFFPALTTHRAEGKHP